MVNKRVIAGILSFSFLLGFIGCDSFDRVPEEEKIKYESYNNIFPKPLKYETSTEKFKLNKDTKIYVMGKNEEETRELYNVAAFFNEKIVATSYKLEIVKGKAEGENYIYLNTVDGTDDMNREEYKIESKKSHVEIKGNRPDGIFMGVQTLRQMLPEEIELKETKNKVEWLVDGGVIQDKPEYEYRSLMIDVSRHFFTVEQVKRQIDLASSYKINKIHLHLSDDQGFRLEINKWPDLTKIGGTSQVGAGSGGFYTQDEFKEIVDYAGKRYVEIIPEFDMPGHTQAMLASYGFLNPDGQKADLYRGCEVGFSSLMCRDEKTYEFIEDIISEVAKISPSKYIHIGGDEADATKKEDYDYFVKRVSDIVRKYDKIPIGWGPIDSAKEIDSNTILQYWKGSLNDAKEKNMKMIIADSTKTYVDMKYDANTKDVGLTWAGYSSVMDAYDYRPEGYAPKELILGVEAVLWTETINDEKKMDYMIYPRLIGHAEVGWTPTKNRVYSEYEERLKNHKGRLENKGINFYKDPLIWSNK